MSTILELREKRNKIWNTAKEFLDQKRGADGLVSVEAAAEYDKMEADMVALGKEIMAKSALPIISADNLADAAQKVVKAVQEAA